MIEVAGGERTFVVDPAEANSRLDAFLARRCVDLSRAQLQRALGAGLVTVEERQRPKGFRLRSGMRVRLLPLPAPAPSTALAQDLPLRVVHADESLIVIDKAAGQVVHPAPGHPDGTLVNALLHHCRALAALADGVRPGIVHRLDRDTSGLLVVALTDSAHRALSAQMKRRAIRREYLALSWGGWAQPEGRLDGPIGRHLRWRQRMAVRPERGRAAVTLYSVVEDFGFAQLCRVRLETGRTHQIRVHFSHAGHPIVGDPVYGDDARARGVHPLDRAQAGRLVRLAGRQLLHATELRLRHPVSGEDLVFRSEPPPDMSAALALLRGEESPADAGP